LWRDRFASLQSVVGQSLLRRHGLPPSYVESIVFVSNGRAHHHSVAVLEAFFRLSAPWTFLYALMLIPRRYVTCLRLDRFASLSLVRKTRRLPDSLSGGAGRI
jgi:predicted DCC family thiol-disulfide oxidoreductase YuxK